MTSIKQPKEIPGLEISRAEFATLPLIKSQADIQAHADAGADRVRCKGDCGNWFICYPQTKHVFIVRFSSRLKSSAGNSRATVLLGKSIGDAIAFREGQKNTCQ